MFRFEPMNVILFIVLFNIAVTAHIPERSRPFPTNILGLLNLKLIERFDILSLFYH